MIILAIETSCDETAVSVVEARGSFNDLEFDVLGSAIQSQIKIHEEWGGVVPNLARREHEKNLPIVLNGALKKANITESNIDLVVVTVGPGLEPALWVGILFAKAMAEKLNVPIIGANHMNGHLASVLINSKFKLSSSANKLEKERTEVEFPALGLLISGGHTELVYMKSWQEKEKIGETKDDAVGEAFDKVARMLGLPYPGGPEISKLADEARTKGLSLETKFPRPMIHSKDFNFSFSGLKTAVLYYLRDLKTHRGDIARAQENVLESDSRTATGGRVRGFFSKKIPRSIERIFSRATNDHSDNLKLKVAREFEDAVVETLIGKTKKAIEKYQPKTLILGGGVVANKTIRESFLKLEKETGSFELMIPEKEFTTDNATMIAIAGYLEYLNPERNNLPLKAEGNLDL